MPGAWPPMPEWLRVDVAPNPVRRGERVRVRWEADEPTDGRELRLVLVVHRDRVGPPGQLGLERRLHVVHGRAALARDGDAPSLRVPLDAPYSYPGRILAFFWGVALARTGVEELDGWTALAGAAVKLRIELDDRLAGLRRGARLAGTATAGGSGDARSVEAWLELAETVPGCEHVATRTHPVQLHAGPIPPGHALRFALRLPPGALPSLDTEWGSLRWRLVVRVDRPPRPEIREEIDLDVLA